MPDVTISGVLAGCLMVGLLTPAFAQGIYTCVDAKGRRLTSDRPIIECLDREQRELSPSGVVKRRIGPSLTADERAAEEEKKRTAQEERARGAEEKRRDRALVTRYPDKATHDKERSSALAAADGVIASANQHTEQLVKERKRLDAELEFFKNDPSKAPAKLKRQIEENVRSLEAQRRFVLVQEEEKKRINARFEEELAKLRQAWAHRATPATARAPASAGVKQ